MSAIPPVKLLDADMLQNNPSGFVDSLNQFTTGVNNALTNGLTVGDNMSAQVNDLQIFVSNEQLPYPFSFSWGFPGVKPQGCIIVRMDSTDGVESVFSSPSPRWDYNDGRIVIKGIRANLTMNKWYQIRFYTFG